MSKIDGSIQSLKYGNEKFVLTDEGDIDKFLWIEILHLDEKQSKISRPLLFDRIICLLNIDNNTYVMEINTNSTLVGKPLLHMDL